MNYTLHFGLYDIDEERLEEIIQSANDAGVDPLEVYCEGDSFLEWGERMHEHNGDYYHGMIQYDASSLDAAFRIGVAIYRELLMWPDPLASLGASCMSTNHIPFVVTLSENWGCVVGPDGHKRGDMLSWQEHNLT